MIWPYRDNTVCPLVEVSNKMSYFFIYHGTIEKTFQSLLFPLSIHVLENIKFVYFIHFHLPSKQVYKIDLRIYIRAMSVRYGCCLIGRWSPVLIKWLTISVHPNSESSGAKTSE